jgi:hypothetical protein
MLSMTIMVKDTDRIRSDAFPTGKYGNEDRDYLSIDFYDYVGRDISGHLRITVEYEQAVELHKAIGRSLIEIRESQAGRREAVTTGQSWDHAGGVAGTGDGQ